jgi:hypothetical protein
MNEQRLRDVMANWVRWQRRPNDNLGYPPRVIGMQSGGVVTSEDRDMPQSEAYASVDDAEARTVQVIVDDLPGQERDAVYNVWLRTSRPLGVPQELAYASAVTLLRMAFFRRGVMGA